MLIFRFISILHHEEDFEEKKDLPRQTQLFESITIKWIWKQCINVEEKSSRGEIADQLKKYCSKDWSKKWPSGILNVFLYSRHYRRQKRIPNERRHNFPAKWRQNYLTKRRRSARGTPFSPVYRENNQSPPGTAAGQPVLCHRRNRLLARF